MATYSTSDFRGGLKVLIDGSPCSIMECDFVKPGKGQAFTRVKLRNLKTGKVLDKTLKSNETLEAADVLEVDMQYLYSDGENWHFMNPESFEQYEIGEEVIGEAKKWLKEEDTCLVTLYNGQPIIVLPPNFVSLVITETDPGLRGDTSGGGSKAATLETGATIRVPLFLQEGEKIKVDTRTAEYVSRDKD